MHYHVYIVDPPTLLDDLLEDSARVFHHHCVIIQRVFHERWLELVGERIGQEQIKDPDANPSVVEANARRFLQPTRKILREKQAMLIEQERDKRAQRDAAIRAYIAHVKRRRGCLRSQRIRRREQSTQAGLPGSWNWGSLSSGNLIRGSTSRLNAAMNSV